MMAIVNLNDAQKDENCERNTEGISTKNHKLYGPNYEVKWNKKQIKKEGKNAHRRHTLVMSFLALRMPPWLV